MRRLLKLALLAGACGLASSTAMAQAGLGAHAAGSKISGSGNATGGTAGSAAAGGTSASTIGLGASSTGRAGAASAVGGAGSAAVVNGRATANTRIRENPQMLRARSTAAARDHGTWSRSMTKTSVRNGDVRSWTRSMAHQPGGRLAMSTSRVR